MAFSDASEEEIRAIFDLIPSACARVARVLPNQRARFVDEEVERAVGKGIAQYVILGAGLDSFAWRRSDLMADIEREFADLARSASTQSGEDHVSAFLDPNRPIVRATSSQRSQP